MNFGFSGKLTILIRDVLTMKGKIITKEIISAFHKKLSEEEKAAATVEKYLRDVKAFLVIIIEEQPLLYRLYKESRDGLSYASSRCVFF